MFIGNWGSHGECHGLRFCFAVARTISVVVVALTGNASKGQQDVVPALQVDWESIGTLPVASGPWGVVLPYSSSIRRLFLGSQGLAFTRSIEGESVETVFAVLRGSQDPPSSTLQLLRENVTAFTRESVAWEDVEVELWGKFHHRDAQHLEERLIGWVAECEDIVRSRFHRRSSGAGAAAVTGPAVGGDSLTASCQAALVLLARLKVSRSLGGDNDRAYDGAVTFLSSEMAMHRGTAGALYHMLRKPVGDQGALEMLRFAHSRSWPYPALACRATGSFFPALAIYREVVGESEYGQDSVGEAAIQLLYHAVVDGMSIDRVARAVNLRQVCSNVMTYLSAIRGRMLIDPIQVFIAGSVARQVLLKAQTVPRQDLDVALERWAAVLRTKFVFPHSGHRRTRAAIVQLCVWDGGKAVNGPALHVMGEIGMREDMMVIDRAGVLPYLDGVREAVVRRIRDSR